jgi:hypothetical protein
LALTKGARLSEADLLKVVGLHPTHTGLPMTIWIESRGRSRHAPRIKVQTDHRPEFDLDNLAVVTVKGEPQVKAGSLSTGDLDLVRRYIVLNRAAILDHWSGKTDGVGLVGVLKALG